MSDLKNEEGQAEQVKEEKTEKTTNGFDKKEIEENKGMAILSYIIPPIPYFTKKDSKYVQFHARQGMDLFVISIAYVIISNILKSIIKVTRTTEVWGIPTSYQVTPGWLTLPLNLISLVIGVIAIIGIINVVNGESKELPIINKFKIFK